MGSMRPIALSKGDDTPRAKARGIFSYTSFA